MKIVDDDAGKRHGGGLDQNPEQINIDGNGKPGKSFRRGTAETPYRISGNHCSAVNFSP